MSADFKADPLRYIYDELVKIEAEASQVRDAAPSARGKATRIVRLSRELLDKIRPTLAEDVT